MGMISQMKTFESENRHIKQVRVREAIELWLSNEDI